MSLSRALAFFTFASLVACSAATDPNDDDASSSQEISSSPTTSCAAAGGACVALTPWACPGGTWADATQVSCGGGLGVGCCLAGPPSPPPPPPPPPPSPNACEAAGGDCVGLSPSSCADGRWGDAATFSCGGGLGVGCCLPSCPNIAPPAPGFCPGGTVTPKKSAAGCTVGFDCTPAPQPQSDCASKGGKCVGLTPTACAGGSWADAATHSCGGGLGVGCCIE